MLEISFGDITHGEEYYLDALSRMCTSNMILPYIQSIKDRSNPKSRVSSLCALYELYRLLEQNGIDIKDLDLAKTHSGKPYFTNSHICFSISHTDKKFAVAICDSDVGIDIEDKILSDEKMQSIAKRYFKADGLEYITDRDSFLKVWTFYEAYAKMQGVGLAKIIGQAIPTASQVNKIYKDYNGAVICVCYE